MTESNGSLKLLWLTDLHLQPAGSDLAGHDTIARLDRAITYMQQHHADAQYCILSGDLTDTGENECYQYIHHALSSANIQYLPMAGNHDLRDGLNQHLQYPTTSCAPFVQYAVNQNGCRIIALDTLSEGVSDGRLCNKRMAWLEGELTRDTTSPTIVFSHHPPASLHLGLLDDTRLVEGETFLGLLNQFDNVKHLCFGHVHRPVSGHFNNVGFTGLRATSIQAPLPYPPWSWDTFEPAVEAPELGIIYFSADNVVIQTHAFAAATDDLQI